jgi:hypothetical protein
LKYPNFSEEFILTTDASIDGAGAVLSQGEIGKDLPVAFASRSFNKAERRYSTIERELAAILWGIKYFRPYLFDCFLRVVTDHKPLKWMMNVKDPGSRLMRWRIQLTEYDFEVVHKPGKQNTNADALSSVNVLERENTEPLEIDADMKTKILQESHDSVLGGHRGMNKTYTAIREHYNWPKMREDVENYVKRCTKC